jgi:hypothetical protein
VLELGAPKLVVTARFLMKYVLECVL